MIHTDILKICTLYGVKIQHQKQLEGIIYQEQEKLRDKYIKTIQTKIDRDDNPALKAGLIYALTVINKT